MSTVLEGWPSTEDGVPQEIKSYFSCRADITVQNGLLFKGERIIAPSQLRKEMMEKIHSSLLGIERCLRRAREVFYWPRMNDELKDFIFKCNVCNSFKPQQPQEPLMPHEIPTRPWQKVGTDSRRLIASRQKQAYYYNLKGKALPELQPGQIVRMKKPNEKTWTVAVWFARK